MQAFLGQPLAGFEQNILFLVHELFTTCIGQ